MFHLMEAYINQGLQVGGIEALPGSKDGSYLRHNICHSKEIKKCLQTK